MKEKDRVVADHLVAVILKCSSMFEKTASVEYTGAISTVTNALTAFLRETKEVGEHTS